jgi:hypothetical protein
MADGLAGETDELVELSYAMGYLAGQAAGATPASARSGGCGCGGK